MRTYLAVVLGLAITFSIPQATTTQEKRPAHVSSDTARTQKKNLKKPEPMQKIKIQYPRKGEVNPWQPDSLNSEIQRPLLRQKDALNNSH